MPTATSPTSSRRSSATAANGAPPCASTPTPTRNAPGSRSASPLAWRKWAPPPACVTPKPSSGSTGYRHHEKSDGGPEGPPSRLAPRRLGRRPRYFFVVLVAFLAGAFLAAGFLAAGLRAVVFLAAGLRAVVFLAAGLRAVEAFLAAGLRAGAFRAAGLRAVVFLAA